MTDERSFRPMAEMPRTGLLTLTWSDGYVRLCEIQDGKIIPREGFAPIGADVIPTGWREPVRHNLRATS